MQLTIPTSWSEVSIAKFLNLEKAKDYPGNNIHKYNALLAAAADVDVKELESNFDFKQALSLDKDLEWILTYPDEIIREFTIDGVKYKLRYDIYSASTGQYADLTEYLKKYKETGDLTQLVYCAAVMCVPEGDKYDGSKVEERTRLFRDKLTIDILYPYTAFFLELWKRSEPIIKTSLRNRLKEINQMMNQTLTETVEALSNPITSTGNG